MLLPWLLSAIHPLSFAAAVLLIVRIVDIWIQQRAHCKQRYGEPTKFPQWTRLGIRMLLESYHNLKNESYLSLVRSRFATLGNTFAFHQLGSEGFLTIEPQNVKAILSTQFQDFGLGSQRARHFEPFIGHGIFTADGQVWQRSRQLLRPCFSNAKLEDTAMFERHTDALLQHIPMGDLAEVDLQELFLRLTMDISTEMLFGQSTSLLEGVNVEQGDRFAIAFQRSQKAMLRSFALGWISEWMPEGAESREDKAAMHDFIAPYVSRAINSKRTPQPTMDSSYCNFASSLAQYTTDPGVIGGELLNILLAGRDTTANLLSSLFFVLARQPSIYERLVSEVSATTRGSGGPPTLGQLRSMPYLKACVNECLRLYPPIPRNSRVALRDTTLPKGGGPDGTEPIRIRKGSSVGYQIFSMHRRKDIFGDDAEDFVPERWMRPAFRPGWAFLPFNGGLRICLGQQFAINQALYVTVRLLQQFESLEAEDDKPWTEDLGLSCSLRHGVRVRVKTKPQLGVEGTTQSTPTDSDTHIDT